MGEDFWTSCPHCEAKLRLRGNAVVGEKKRCPSCREPFTLEASRIQKSAKRSSAASDVDHFVSPRSASPGSRAASQRTKSKRGTRKKRTTMSPLLWGLIGGGVLILAIIV